jgi:YidC/Oxa1 family membrane protein insertase
VDNRRLLVAALLSMAVLFFWQIAFPPPEPPVRTAAAPIAAPGALVDSPSTPESTQPPAVAVSADGGVATALPATELEPIAASAEERVVLENELLRAEFSNRGAQLLSLGLKSKLDLDGSPLELVQRRGETPHPFALVDSASAPVPADLQLFAVARDAGVEPEVHFHYRGDGGEIEKRFRLRGDGRLDFEVVVRGPAAGWGVLLGPGVRNTSKEELESRFLRRSAVWFTAGEVETLDAGDGNETLRLPGAALSWVGLEDTYFLTAADPGGGRGPWSRCGLPAGLRRARRAGCAALPSRCRPSRRSARAQSKLPRSSTGWCWSPAGERARSARPTGAPSSTTASRSCRAGSSRRSTSASSASLARAAAAVALHWIYENVVANYGWAIVLLTVLIKMVLLPLTHKSRSCRCARCRSCSPRCRRSAKYRPKLKDKQGRPNIEMQRKMNEEIMGALQGPRASTPRAGACRSCCRCPCSSPSTSC